MNNPLIHVPTGKYSKPIFIIGWSLIVILIIFIVIDAFRSVRVSLTRSGATGTLDQYGGMTDLPCPGGPTTRFTTAKLGNRWVFCTPDGNAFYMLGVSHFDNDSNIPDQGVSYDTIVQQKYTEPVYWKHTWARESIKRMKSWGFNTLTDYTSVYAFPWTSPATQEPIAQSPIIMMSNYTYRNVNNLGTPTKSLMECLSGSAYTGWVGRGLPDVYDATYDTYINNFLAWAKINDVHINNYLTSPWVVGVVFDEGDDIFGLAGAGLEAPNPPSGIYHPHIGYISLACKPSMPTSTRWNQTYSDPTVHTKAELKTFLQNKYGTIAALNTAWGSNYTTFSSSAQGWPTGSGLMDEDGSSSWLGDRDGTLRNASAGVTADLDEFLTAWATKYFQVLTTRFRQHAPNRVLISPVLNGWSGLTRRQVLQVASQYVDVIGAKVSYQELLDKTVLYAGDKPLWDPFVGTPGNADSSLWRYNNHIYPNYTTQAQRAQDYQTSVNFLGNATAASTGAKPIVGFTYWEWHDNWGEKLNWGLNTFRDNAYDGNEAKMGNRTCSPGYTTVAGYNCGGEERDYGDIITGVRATNEFVRSLLTGTTTPPTPDTTPPSTPQNLSANAVSSSQINLIWSASSDNVGVAGYKVYRDSNQIATSPTNSYSDTGLAPSTSYTYTVSAYDAAGNVSAESGLASATTSPDSQTWVFCANEYEFCSFAGIKEVRYGANSQYNYLVLTGGTMCNNEVFGDPAPGTVKQCHYRDVVPISDLIAAYSFDETSGTAVVDSSGNGNSGTITGATRTAGHYGSGALDFSSAAKVTMPSSASLNSNYVTASFWVKLRSATPWAHILGRDDSYTPSERSFDINQDGGTAQNLYGFASTNSGIVSMVSNSIPSLNVWHHVAYTYDGASQKFYIDGVMTNSVPHTGTLVTGNISFTIGSNFASPSADMILDNVRLYSRALSASEIVTDMNTPIGGGTPPPPPPPDTSPPVVSVFDVQPRSTTGSVTLSWTVSDAGGSHLSRVETQRSPYNATSCSETNKSGCIWAQIQSLLVPAISDSWLSSSTDSPSVGSYWYGIHAVDNAGNRGYEPIPIKVTITSPSPQISIGARVKTTAKVKVRQTPSTKGKALCTTAIGALGTVIAGPTQAGGFTWWQINYDTSCDGWSVGDYLMVVP